MTLDWIKEHQGMFKYLYHKFMAAYWGWRLNREINKVRKFAASEGVNFSQYTNEQIVQGFKLLQNRKKNGFLGLR
ncbi:hypothetical protein C4565_00550 [Candidatus Parcubacteria bacterium]|nr:MAG: hypothetical protein C4565_00550 [Candidatus Parcubacteria bacterium]